MTYFAWILSFHSIRNVGLALLSNEIMCSAFYLVSKTLFKGHSLELSDGSLGLLAAELEERGLLARAASAYYGNDPGTQSITPN